MSTEPATLAIQPGLLTEATRRDAEPRWFSGSNVRFRAGWPEKLGGWVESDVDDIFKGTCRQLFEWTAIDGSVWTAIGTHSHLYVVNENILYDVTPLDEDAPGNGSGTLGTDPFTTTNGSAVVSIAHTSHGRVAGDFVVFDGASAVGGITVDGEYAVTEVTDANTYTVTHSAAATSTATGGGASVTYEYLVPTGNAAVTYLNGYSVGSYGHSGGYGMPTPSSNLTEEPRIWVFDKWGEDLVANIRGAKIYTWDKSGGTATRASRISGSPATCNWVLVSDNRQLLAFGAHDGTASDPLLIRFSDEEDFTDMTPSDTNAAGDLRLDSGGKIVRALHGRSEKVVFTDKSVYAVRFRGSPFFWGKDPVAQNVRLFGPNAAVMVQSVLFCMLQEDFAIYDGVFRILPCDIRNEVFEDINRDLAAHTVAGVNSDFTEVWFAYPTAAASENDRVAIYNYVEKTWSLADFSRTAWHDASPQFGKPYGVNADDGKLFRHEVGSNANDTALEGYLESYAMEIGEGSNYMHADRLEPDFLEATGDVTITLKGYRYAQSGVLTTKGPYDITSSTEKIDTRFRARMASLRIDFTGLNTHFRMGNWKLSAKSHGRR